MVAVTQMGWRDLKAEMTRHEVTVADVARRMGYGYARFSTLLASQDETQPLPAFATRVMAAIEALASERR